MIAIFIIETFVILWLTGFVAHFKLKISSLITNQKFSDSYIKNLESELIKKDKIIKFLGDQNLILSDIPKIYHEHSETIRNDNMKKLDNKLKELLQTSK